MELHAVPQDALETVQNFGLTVAQVIDDDRYVARFSQCNNRVGADKARTSCHENTPMGFVLGHGANIGNPQRLCAV